MERLSFQELQDTREAQGLPGIKRLDNPAIVRQLSTEDLLTTLNRLINITKSDLEKFKDPGMIDMDKVSDREKRIFEESTQAFAVSQEAIGQNSKEANVILAELKNRKNEDNLEFTEPDSIKQKSFLDNNAGKLAVAAIVGALLLG